MDSEVADGSAEFADASDAPEHAAGHASDARTDLGVGDHLRHAAVIAHQEYSLGFRNRWTPGLVVLFALFSTMLVLFSGSRVGPARFGPLVASLGSLATYLVPLAAFAYGYDVVVGADERGWLDVLISLPIPRSGVVLGKLGGRVAAFSTATVVGFGLAAVVVAVGYGSAAAWGVYATFVLAALGLGTAFLGIGALVSTVAPQKTHALGGGLLAWVWFVLIHDLVALGVVATLDLGSAVLVGVLLANPADIFRVLVLRSAGATGGGFAAAFAETQLSTPVLGVALLAWCLVPAAAAALLIERRSV
ncbi:MAG: ABC transporter permease [Haloferacaceae archaeon]